MDFNKRTLQNVNVMGKRVLMRTDFNVPIKNGVVEDDYRIKQSLPTIEYVMRSGAVLILVSHLGRPEGKVNMDYSLSPVAAILTKLLHKRVKMAPATVGADVEKLANKLRGGDVMLLENVRFHPEETAKNRDVREEFAKKLASLADLFINDAFAVSHREHASIATITKFIPSCAGLLLEREIFSFERILYTPPRPMMVLLGGIKIETKLPLIRQFLPKADKIFIGGGMAYNFFKAMNLGVGTFPLEERYVDEAGRLLKESAGKLEVPSDVVAGTMDLERRQPLEQLRVYSKRKIPSNKAGYDIGPQTIRRWSSMLSSAKSVLWNGPMGFFECPETRIGTVEIAKILAQLTKKGVLTIVGGGDSAAAIKQAGLVDDIKHLSTGGGAALMYLEGRSLPGIIALEERI